MAVKKSKKKNSHDEKIARETAHLMFQIGIVHFRFDPPYIFTTGLKSPIYLDNRILMSFAKERKKIVDFYIDIIKKKVGLKKIDCISATAMGAIPLGAWIADRLKVPLVYVRARSKAHGKANKLEGHFKKGYRTLIIEDHISTAKSVLNNADTIKQLGGKVSFCVGLSTYESHISYDNLKKNKIKTYTLTTGKVILEEALKKKLLDGKEAESIKEWFIDPEKWAEDQGYNDPD